MAHFCFVRFWATMELPLGAAVRFSIQQSVPSAPRVESSPVFQKSLSYQ